MHHGFSNPVRLAIIASQIPFCLTFIDECGWFAVVGWTGLVLYGCLTIAIIWFAIADRRKRLIRNKE